MLLLLLSAICTDAALVSLVVVYRLATNYAELFPLPNAGIITHDTLLK